MATIALERYLKLIGFLQMFPAHCRYCHCWAFHLFGIIEISFMKHQLPSVSCRAGNGLAPPSLALGSLRIGLVDSVVDSRTVKNYQELLHFDVF